MPILGIIASSKLTAPVPFAAYESIASTFLSGGQASITFSSIPATFTHLQLRGHSAGQDNTNIFIRFNGDTGSNYSYHLIGNMASDTTATSGAGTSQNGIIILDQQTGGSTYWNPSVVDILDYRNANKYKTTRSLNGVDRNSNSGGFCYLISGNWRNTAAITSISIQPVSNNLNTNTRFSLYGLKVQ